MGPARRERWSGFRACQKSVFVCLTRLWLTSLLTGVFKTVQIIVVHLCITLQVHETLSPLKHRSSSVQKQLPRPFPILKDCVLSKSISILNCICLFLQHSLFYNTTNTHRTNNKHKQRNACSLWKHNNILYIYIYI